MSRLLSLLNRLKSEAGQELLTSSQLAALEALEKAWDFPERINLWGSAGSGKTFLGWVVAARTSPSAHHASPDAFINSDWAANDALHIIDNASSDPNSLRRLIAEMQLRNIRTSLIISTTANTIGLPTVHLPAPTVRDITAVYRTLNKLDQYALTPRQDGNLWQIIYSVL